MKTINREYLRHCYSGYLIAFEDQYESIRLNLVCSIKYIGKFGGRKISVFSAEVIMAQLVNFPMTLQSLFRRALFKKNASLVNYLDQL